MLVVEVLADKVAERAGGEGQGVVAILAVVVDLVEHLLLQVDPQRGQEVQKVAAVKEECQGTETVDMSSPGFPFPSD